MRASRARRIARELQLLDSSRLRPLRFHGQSMQPLLQEGDLVVVDRVDWKAIEVGDVVTYRDRDRFPTRRVVRKSARRLDLWCDNWPELRYRTRRRDLLGRVVARRRGEQWLYRHDEAWRAAARQALERYRGSRAARLDRRRARRERWSWLFRHRSAGDPLPE